MPGARTTDEGDHTLATWDVVVPPGQAVTHELLLTVDDTSAAVSAPSRRAGWSQVEVASADRRLAPVLERSLDDLRLLRLAARGADDVEEEFIGAGAPWFLTLFGRDSLWTARMLLPVTTDLAMSTLRLLAHHQGTRTDDVTAEEPGKILHEVRSAGFSLGEDDGADRHLPPVYYGTIDATPLWAMTLHDAWRWGARPTRSSGCCRPSSAPSPGRSSTATPTATCSWSTSTGPATACPTRAGRTPATPYAAATARAPPRRSRWPRSRAMRTPPRPAAPTCSRRSAGPAPTAGGSGPSSCARSSPGASGWRTPSAPSPPSRSTATSARSSR